MFSVLRKAVLVIVTFPKQQPLYISPAIDWLRQET